jgi:hypothetical protein
MYMKKIILFITCLFCLASCHIITQEEPVAENEKAYEAYGLLTIPSSGFTKDSLRVKIVEKEDATMDVYMFDVKFAAGMPVTIDMLVSGVGYAKSGSEIRFSELYDGEFFDAGLAGDACRVWRPVRRLDWSREILIPQEGEEIREQERLSRSAANMEEKLAITKKINELERQKRKKRNELADREDEVSDQRRRMIDELDRRMVQRAATDEIFVVEWRLE